MSRFLILFVLIVGIVAPTASAQTPEAGARFTYVSGTALDLVPEGEPGIIDIIPVGPFSEKDFGLPVVVWNSTEEAVTGLHVFGTIRTASGMLRAAVDTPVYPDTVLPGEFAFAVVEFAKVMQRRVLDPGDLIAVEYYFPDVFDWTYVPLIVIDANIDGDRLVGQVRIPSRVSTYPVRIIGMCFGADGEAFSGLIVGGRDETRDKKGSDDTMPFGAVWPDAFTPECDRWLVTAEAIT